MLINGLRLKCLCIFLMATVIMCFGDDFDLAIGPKISSNHDVAIEVTMYDLMIGSPNLDQKQDASKWAMTFEGTVYKRGEGKQFGVGLEYLTFGHEVRGKDRFPWNIYFPNPQVVINHFSDGEFGISASIFFMWLVIPFYEFDFKERKNVVGVYLKFPILRSLQ
jgi:hypothetical protein